MIPNIKKTEFNFEGSISLEQWRDEFDDWNDIFLNIGGDAFVDSIDCVHVRGYEYLIENQNKILETIKKEIYNYYIKLMSEIGETSLLKCEMDIFTFIEPEGIYIHNVDKGGIPYIGYEFSCDWDEEHGVGIILYKDSIISIGSGDIAVLSWISQEDLEQKI